MFLSCLVGTPVHSSGTRLTLTLGGGPRDPRPVIAPYPLPSASILFGFGRGIGGARGLGNLVRPEPHPEPRGFPVQWADPVVNPYY